MYWLCQTHEHKQARKVSLSSANRSLSKVVCIHHFHLGNLHICHVMDGTKRYSTGAIVPHTGMKAAVWVLDSYWISPFWVLESIQFDQAFANKEFTEFLSLHGINARSVPAQCHNKNVIESKHKVIKDIFLRTKSTNADLCETLAVQQAIHISNDLCGNDTCFAHELAKDFTRAIVPDILPKIVPKDLVTARKTLIAKRKFNLTLSSKSTSVTPIQIGDLVQVFVKLQHKKRGKWSNPNRICLVTKNQVL